MLTKKISVMVLAAGYGKRLKPITEKIPKPLVKVAGITLLQNTLDQVLSLNCKEIIINTHYQHKMIYDFIKSNYARKNIIITYEKELLDTGGGVKNALPFFQNNNVLILNSDIFWKPENFQDIKNLIINFKNEQKCKLLLVTKDQAHGIYNDKGDFIIQEGLIKRYKKNRKKYFYSGAQIISLEILKDYKKEKFSFNMVWDQLIDKQLLFGDVMTSDWYHIGNKKGLKEAENLMT
tara:strand:+ start:285 stop:989 length:705 start_codon:yes stop_codon:yes gene_type:complete